MQRSGRPRKALDGMSMPIAHATPGGARAPPATAQPLRSCTAAATAARVAKRMLESSSSGCEGPSTPSGAAERSSIAGSEDSDRRSSLRRKTTTRHIFSPQLTQSPGGRHLLDHREAEPPPALVTGFRVASMDTFRDDLQPYLQCPTCKQTGVMEARAHDGLAQCLFDASIASSYSLLGHNLLP